MSKPQAPDYLGSTGQSVWKRIVSKYNLRPDELLTLEDACATSDMISDLERVWREDGCPTVTKGSMGQEVIHPLIGEIRTQRSARNALWRQLKLPDETGGEGANQQRSAAQSRWASHGTGA